MTVETWAPIATWEGYFEVSSEGRVRSVPRVLLQSNGVDRRVFGRILAQGLAHGYPKVDLSVGERRETRKVHALVAGAFVSGWEPGLEVCHRDGDRRNARASNLRWGTHGSNNLDAVEHGTHFNASKTHCPRKHEYNEENTFFDKNGWRRCRPCRSEGYPANLTNDKEN